jgi:phenylalanyl-tRNA synthetase alpha chain
MAEALQQLILDTLDRSGTIGDTRTLVIPGRSDPAASHEDQITILGALNSLLSREVWPLNSGDYFDQRV